MKSHESDLLELHKIVYYEACGLCTANVSDLRDLVTIRSRVEQEGLSFLTITLPEFCNDFQQSLAIGRIEPSFFRGFRKRGAIPAFLSGMLVQLFDSETGSIRNEVQLEENPQADYPPRSTDYSRIVEAVRQVCLLFKKFEIGCTPSRDAKAIGDFISVERDLSDYQVQTEDIAAFAAVSSRVWPSVISPIRVDTAKPQHGPGATAEGISGNAKYAWKRWHERLEVYFPLLGTGYPLGAALEEEFENVTFVSPEDEQPVKVTLVPKTSKGPRVIAIEPVCMQYAQQALRDELYTRIENSRTVGGQINFTDQTVNRALALTSSADKSMATIDLKEASDRVPRDLALTMFDSNPELKGAIDACRSTSAQLPDGRVISPLRKFASMGSALCFPVEAMYFYTCCVVALLRFYELPVTAYYIDKMCKQVYIYGDDIIIPADAAVFTIGHLQKYNCKVNTRKSYWHGYFRESCGLDAFAGVEVTPTYLRVPRPDRKQQADRIISWVKTAGMFYERGYFKTADFLYSRVERILGVLPFVSRNSPGLGRLSFLNSPTIGRWNKRLHRPEVKAWVAEPVYRTDELDGYAAMAKSLLLMGPITDENPERDSMKERVFDGSSGKGALALRTSSIEVREIDPLHMRRSAFHGETTLKRRWVPAT